MHIDYLIIGQGLAGSLLAWELIRHHQRRVVVIDEGTENASLVAAGLINPVTGKRFVITDAVDTLLPTALNVYRDLSALFGLEFFIAKPMVRLLRTQEEINLTQKRLQDPAYQAYLGDIKNPDQLNYRFNHFMAVLEQKQTGYLITRPLLARLKNYFISLDSYRQTTLDYHDIHLEPVLQWREFKPKAIVFCEGFKARYNPWFSELPFQPVKGEILTLETAHPLPVPILNYGNWLIPTSMNRFRIGATFEHDTTDTAITRTARRQLLRSLSLVNANLAGSTLVEQQANIRPCTQDRRPFIGHHPKHPELWIFNGFGAKGSLQIPWYSRHLAQTLSSGKPLQPHCDTKRL